MQNHIICRQTIELQFAIDEDRKEISSRIADIYKAILPEIDKVLTKTVPPNIFVEIDKIDLDLGRIGISDFQRDFSSKFISMFCDKLSAGIIHDLIDKKEKTADAVYQISKSSMNIEAHSENVYNLRLFEYILKNGIIPLWSDKRSPDLFKELFLILYQTSKEELRSLLKKNLLTYQVRERLLRQLPEAILGKILDLFVTRTDIIDIVYDLLTMIRNCNLLHMLESERLLIACNSIISFVLKEYHGITDLTDVVRLILKDIAEKEQIQYHELLTSLHSVSGKIEKYYICKSNLKVLIKNEYEELPSCESRSDKISQSLICPGSFNHQNAIRNIVDLDDAYQQEGLRTFDDIEIYKASSESCHTKDITKHGTGTDILIENAGLVIVWPFIRVFFENIGIIKENSFSGVSRKRAVHLLQFIVTGKQGTPEYLLPLNKILCGIDIYSPVSFSVDLSENEIAEADKLLRHLISQWSALKNTSIQGLRKAFLQRDGLITVHKNDVILMVERRSYDILIEQLPWGISTIRLSWMKSPLYIEW